MLGAALIIHAGTSSESTPTRLLCWRPLVYVGVISYPLYLWHWPLIVVARNLNAGAPLGAKAVLVGVASIALASLTYHFVEIPLRTRRRCGAPRQLFALAAVSSACLLVAGGSLWWGRGLPGRYDALTVALDQERDPGIPFRECHDLPMERVRAGDFCSAGAKGSSQKTLIWGDSHALAWLPALDAVLEGSGERGIYAGYSTCPPLVGVGSLANPECLEFNESVERFIARSEDIRTVLLVASWPSYSSKDAEYVIFDRSGVGNAQSFPRALERTAHEMHRLGKTMFVLGAAPGAPPRCPPSHGARAPSGAPMPPAPTASEYDGRTRRSCRPSAARRWRPRSCSSTSSRGSAETSNASTRRKACRSTRDRGHLNVRGAKKVVPQLARALAAGAPRP